MKKHQFAPPDKYKRILSAVHIVYRLVNSTYNVKELTLRLTRLMCQFIKASSSSVYILDPVKKRVQLVAIYNNKINVFLDKKKDFKDIPGEELEVTQGKMIFTKDLIGLPLVADENIGAMFVRRAGREPAFKEFDKEMLTVFAEQSVTAIKNLQLYEKQQKVILDSIKLIKKLVEKHGPLTSIHTPVYTKVVECIAEKLNMSQDGINNLHYACLLHDAGSVDVPFEILSKTSQLTPDEFKVIRDHPAKSVELVKPVDFLKPILPIILYHHEKYDGTGYPSGIKKEQIPLGARVMAVVDAFEAMIRGRPYKRTLSVDEAVQELIKHSGTQFDPKVIKAICELAKQKKFRNYLSLMKE